MSETRTQYAIPDLAVELPSAPVELELMPVSGGALTFRTNATYIINLLREGLPDLEDGDLTRIAELNHCAVQELRKRRTRE